MEENSQKRAEEEVKNEIITKVVDASSVEIPAVMIDRRVEKMINELQESLKVQGLTLEQYLEYRQLDRDKLKEEFRPRAERDVKTDLVMETISKTEGIEAMEEDVKAELEKISQQYNQPVDTVKVALESAGRLDMLEYGIKMNKTIDFLVSQSNIA